MEKVCSKCKTTKEFSLFHKHKGQPHGLARWCKDCAKANSRKHYKTLDPVERLDKKRKWQAENREKVNSYNNEWRKSNPEKHAARQAMRRASKNQATPLWLSDPQKAHIKRTYQLARLMQDITGEEYHVDHIIPLKGDNICGLHVPLNLQVLRADLNLKKSNTFEGEEL